jgi:glycosyltransferase involved in cell wall biosynthesis
MVETRIRDTGEAGGMRALALLTDAFGGHGGIAKFNRDFLGALAAYPGMAQIVAIPRLMPLPPGEIPGNILHRSDAAGSKARFARAVLAALRADRRFGLIVCGHIHLLPLACLAKLASGAPILLVTHGIEAWRPTRSKMANALVGQVDAFISVSDLSRRRFMAWSGLPEARSFILPNCFEPSAFQPGEKPGHLLERYRLRGKTVLMTLGRLESKERAKGFDEILELLPALAEEIPDIAYLIVGDGDDRARLEAKARGLGVERRVAFAGFVAEAEKADHYRLADAYVMPSRGEGFGIVYLEAMACGIPVMGSRIDGSREALREGILGVLVDPDDPGDTRRGILAALARPRGIPEGLDYFTFSNFRGRLWQILSAMLAGGPPQAA